MLRRRHKMKFLVKKCFQSYTDVEWKLLRSFQALSQPLNRIQQSEWIFSIWPSRVLALSVSLYVSSKFNKFRCFVCYVENSGNIPEHGNCLIFEGSTSSIRVSNKNSFLIEEYSVEKVFISILELESWFS